tara:strand:- start:1454 stop:1855 length:402 start_codon:yes stop_codon:yes gene_type:complete
MIDLLFLHSLTAADYYDLAKVVQVEAKLNTQDEYCVAASVLNRVKSYKFPNSVYGVIHAPGQYEGIYRRYNVVPSSALINRLSSSHGQQRVLYWSKILDGRTDYKGQSMLRYRVASQDPMCHPKGNFYHYHWQ